MKINTKISLLFLIAILSVSFVSAADATVTFDEPATDGIFGSITNLNVTISDVSGNFSCIFAASSSLTANLSKTNITGIISNNTDGFGTEASLNTTFDTNILEDANNYVFYADCFNNTDTWTGVTNTGISIDNTVPVAASSVLPADNSRDTDGSITFSGSVTGSQTTSCTLQFVGINFGGTSQAMTHTGDTCSLTLSNVPDQTYNWFIRASDETNTTDSSEHTITADITTSAGKAAVLVSEAGVSSAGGSLLSIAGINDKIPGGMTTLIVIVSLVAIAWFVKKS